MDKSWVDMNSFMVSRFPVVAVDERTFYKAGGFGIHRTVDGGKSWHPFMDGMVGTRILNLVVHNNRLYAHTGSAIAESTDGGASWKGIGTDVDNRTFEPIAEEQFRVDFSFDSRLVVADSVLYEIVPKSKNVRVFYFSVERNKFIPIQGIPAFDKELRSTNPRDTQKTRRAHLSNDVEKGYSLTTMLNTVTDFTEVGAFTVSDKIFTRNTKGGFSSGNSAMQSGKILDWWTPANSPTRI